MKKVETAMDDDLRPEYDLGSLRVRKVGPKRKNFRGQIENRIGKRRLKSRSRNM